MPSCTIVDTLGEPLRRVVASSTASLNANVHAGERAVTVEPPAGLSYWDFTSSSWKLRPAAPSDTSVWDPVSKTWG